ncbi:MAG: ABC transporter permease, partial [archaeon]
VIVQVDDSSELNTVVNRTEKKLMSYRNLKEETKDFSIMTPEELMRTIGVILNIITAFLGGVAAISMLVGAIGIANTMYTSVLERTKEIGTMKAVGARNSDILLIFLIESGLLGLVGGIAGVLFGFGVAKLLEYVAVNIFATSLLQTATPFYLFAGCLLFAFLAGAISGIWPAWRAAHIKTVDALRYE